MMIMIISNHKHNVNVVIMIIAWHIMMLMMMMWMMMMIQMLRLVDGGWGSWNQWAECSKTCAGGVRTRRRVCDNPAPDYGGRHCEGGRQRITVCNNNPCPGQLTERANLSVREWCHSKVHNTSYPPVTVIMHGLITHCFQDVTIEYN